MALNPYTLYNLYNKGILDYVPTDLISGTPMATMIPMSNPYLDMAQQGSLYQSYNNSGDMFQYSGSNALTQNYGQNQNVYTGIGSNSNTSIYGTFNGYGVGGQNTNGIANTFGFNGNLGSQSNSSVMNSFGLEQGSFSNGFNKTVSLVNGMPKLLLGLIAGGIGIIGLTAAFKRGKNRPKQTQIITQVFGLN